MNGGDHQEFIPKIPLGVLMDGKDNPQNIAPGKQDIPTKNENIMTKSQPSTMSPLRMPKDVARAPVPKAVQMVLVATKPTWPQSADGDSWSGQVSKGNFEIHSLNIPNNETSVCLGMNI